MGRQFGVGGKLDSLVGGLGGHGGGIRNDKGDNEFLFIANNHGVEDVRAGLEGVLYGLRCDEFSGGSLQQIFFAIGDEKIVVLVHVADVAGAEPAILAEDFAGGFGILVIALHDARAFDENFSVFGGADLHVGNRFAGTAHTIVGIIAGDDGRSFRQAVTLVDGNSDGPEKLGELFGKRSAARADKAEAATHTGPDFAVDQGVSEPALERNDEIRMALAGAPPRRHLGHSYRPIKEHFLHASGL